MLRGHNAVREFIGIHHTPLRVPRPRQLAGDGPRAALDGVEDEPVAIRLLATNREEERAGSRLAAIVGQRSDFDLGVPDGLGGIDPDQYVPELHSRTFQYEMRRAAS